MRPDQLENPDTDLHVLAAWLRNRKLEVDLHEHYMAPELRKLQASKYKFPGMSAMISPHQLHVKGSFGCISVIRGGCSFGDYEIYCIDGDIFSGIRRYRDVDHAGKTIYSLVTTGMFDESVPRVSSVMEDLFGHSDGGDGSVHRRSSSNG